MYTGHMRKCPHCQDTEQQVKAGFTGSRSQMYKCKPCDRRYVLQSRQYSPEMRQAAVQCYADGMTYRQVARHFKVDHKTIINWVKAHADQLPPAPTPSEKPLHIIEMDELHTFVGRKKTDGT